MPDADDFDVEYFRDLLKGNCPQDAATPPAKPAPTASKKTLRQIVKPSATKEKSAATRGRKNDKNR